jgi:hypothetical protein
MKINKLAFNLITLATTVIFLDACSSTKEFLHIKSKPKRDCSAVFEGSAARGQQDWEAECNVLPVQLSQNAKCEIAGSEEIDNLLKFYSHNQDSRFVFIGSLKSLVSNDASSFQNLILYYKIKINLTKHLDSNLFDGLKDFRYKGLKCEIEGNKFVAWIGDGKVVVALEIKKEVKARAAVEKKIIRNIKKK